MTRPERPLRWYRGAPRSARLHVALRWATCPFGALEALVPTRGRILDWGTGHGVGALWLAQRSAARTVHGTDLDPEKVAVAAAAALASPFADRVSFAPVAPASVPDGTWDAVVVVDVLYLLDPERQDAAIAAAAGSLAPGGALVVKDMADHPTWKATATGVQEQLVVRGLRLTATEGGVHRPPGPDRLVAAMAAAGLETSVHRLDRGYHCPHVAVVGRRGPGRPPGSRPAGTS